MAGEGLVIDWQNVIRQRLGGRQLPDLPARLEVPRPPQCVAEFIQLVDRPETSMDDVAAVIEKDSEVTSSVLRLVNGSQMMLREKMTSISRAIGLLGLQRCKMLIMSAAIQSSMNVGRSSRKQLSRIIQESQERALYAQRLATVLGGNAEVAYVSALLQDLLLPQLLASHHQVYDEYQPETGSLVDFERERLEYDHTILAAALLSQWNFADEIVACVAMHHEHEIILSSEQFLHSEVAAVSISSLLPGIANQEPQGILRFMEYQQAISNFDFLQVATDVDERISSLPFSYPARASLADRLKRLAIAVIEQKPNSGNWIERSIGSYTLEEQIGQGGMGVVYRARHSMLRRPAAVKMLKGSRLSAEALKRFDAEADATSELSSPHTVQVYDYGMTPEGTLYYVMEYLDGMSLAELVARTGPLPEGRIIHILCQVCGSLAEAHAKTLIHRDIKAENIALTVCGGAHDFAKVLDFGLVAVKDEIPLRAGTDKIIGTPSYMSPESIQSPDLVDERTDIYAIGAVAYFCLKGEPLFAERNVMEILGAQVSEIPDLSKFDCSEEFREIVRECLAKKPADRPQNVMLLARRLANCTEAVSWTFESAKLWWKEHPLDMLRDDQVALNATTQIVGQQFRPHAKSREMVSTR